MSTQRSNSVRPRRPTLSPRKSAQQKRNRRKIGLMKKAYEYSELCDADVCVGIRLRESGHVFTFLSDPTGFWSKLDSLLVRYMRARLCQSILTMRQETYYPRPVRKTGENFRSRSGNLGSKDHVPVAVSRSTVSGHTSSLGV
jgi:hypothetical protein